MSLPVTTIPNRDPSIPECRVLWLAVIECAIDDARGSSDLYRGQAIAWLFSPLHKDDFVYVCDCAGVNYKWVRDRARSAGITPLNPVLPQGDDQPEEACA